PEINVKFIQEGRKQKMNTMRKIRKNAKALSPVVASIILIAVTVAVSIAVAVWMGALSTGFMQTEQLSIVSATYPDADNILITVRNTGSSTVTITGATINNNAATMNATWTSFTTAANSHDIVRLNQTWVAGN